MPHEPMHLVWNDGTDDLARNGSSDPSPADAPDTNDSSTNTSNTTTETMSTSFTDPVAELRDRAGASSGATGSEVLASGGSVLEATQTLRGLRGDYESPTEQLGAARRLIESGATDAPSDIISKMRGNGDPNPGHTTEAEANSAVTQATNTVEQTAQQAREALPPLPSVAGSGGSDRGLLALLAAALVGLFALLAGAAGAEG